MTKHRSPDERATQILEAARRCFMRKGYFATKMDEIAKESGLSKGGIYFHFDSKRDIFRSLVELEYERDMEFIDGVINADRDITSMLVELGEHFMRQFTETEKPRFTAIIAEMGLRDEDIRDMLYDLQKSYIDRLAEVLQRSMDEGQLRQVDAHVTAYLLKSIVDGIQAGMAIGGDPPDLERLLTTATEILLGGLIREEALES
ncbi:MAG: TetR/AcrR family transcriptional regulator [Myxococcota bacterium]